jgi:hypothetical protein
MENLYELKNPLLSYLTVPFNLYKTKTTAPQFKIYTQKTHWTKAIHTQFVEFFKKNHSLFRLPVFFMGGKVDGAPITVPLKRRPKPEAPFPADGILLELLAEE